MAELQYITCTDGGSFQITTLPALPTPDSLVTFKHSFSELSSTYQNNFNIGHAMRQNLNLTTYYGTMVWDGGGGTLTIDSAMKTLNTPHTCVWSSSELRYDETTIPLTGNVATVTNNRLTIESIKGNIYFVNSIKNNVYDFNLVPWMDENNVVGLMELTTNTFYTPSSGTWTAGPLAHIFTIDKSNARFDATGGTETVEIEAETTWTASTPSFVSVSPSTGGTGTTQVAITCPSYTGATRREDNITFTDNDNYALTFKAMQNGNSAGFSNIYLGDNNLLSNTIYLGDNAVNTIYLGEEIIYSNGPFVGLKAAPQSLALNNLKPTANITIRSSENWTITDDSGGWLSYSTTTGGTGKTVVTVTASTTQAERTATITVTSTNYSATIGVTDVALIMPLDEVWYKTTNNTKETLRSGTYYIDANGNQLTYTETFDSESGLWKMKFNGNVAGNQGSLYYNSSNKLVELWLPYGFVRPHDIFIYNQTHFEKFKGDSPAIFDNGNMVINVKPDDAEYFMAVQCAKANLTDVVVPDGVEVLFAYFAHKTTASTMTLPSSITTIQNYTFESSVITTMNCYATTCPNVDSNAWWAVNNSGTLHYPAGSDYSSFYVPGSWTKVGDL